jgi:hypothetical protein
MAQAVHDLGGTEGIQNFVPGEDDEAEVNHFEIYQVRLGEVIQDEENDAELSKQWGMVAIYAPPQAFDADGSVMSFLRIVSVMVAW